ncbi:MAG: response regulator transcription factor [Tissierellia bacterium]|nr:response regulator transcription factor [Tissierellia bacterium]
MSTNLIEVMIADDHSLMREGLKQLLELETYINVVAQAEDGKKALRKALKREPDVILLDINMPKMNGIEVLRRFRDFGIKSKVLMLTIHDDREYLLETMNMGADGYILKDVDANTLIMAIKTVRDGGTYVQPSIKPLLLDDDRNMCGKQDEDMLKIKLLTNREYEVLTLIAEGLNNRNIAGKLYISEKTVKNHISSIFKKLGVNDRIQAAIFAFKTNIKKL